MRIIPPWAYAAVAGGLLLFGGFIGWKLASGKVEKLRGKIAVHQAEQQQCEAANEKYVEEFADYTERLKEKTEALATADARYQEEISKPPQIVTKWRTKWKEAPAAVITDSPCEDQLVQVHRFMIEALEQETP